MAAATAATANDDDKIVEAEWSTLPTELWSLVTNRLVATIDILCFRGTCSTWRSAVPLPPPSTKPLFPQQILIPHGNFTLIQTKIYRVIHRHSSSNKGWLIMVGDSKSLPLLLLDPFTNFPISRTRRYSTPKLLNLMDFRFVDFLEAYSLHSHHQLSEFTPVPGVIKVTLLPSSGGARNVFALYNDGKLRVSEIGDSKNWTTLVLDDDDEGNGNKSSFDDMIVRTGQLYAVDKQGTVVWVDCSSLKMVRLSPALCGFGGRKRLVGYEGSLYVVDTYVEGDTSSPMGLYWEEVEVRIYRLDEELSKWLEVKDLGDAAFVLGRDSNFVLSSRDYYGCESNTVYFYSGGLVCAFNLENSKYKCAKLFWPCPSLFHPKP